VQIRPEKEADKGAIQAVNEAAFETPAESRLVDALREQTSPIVSFVAEVGGAIVGHIMFSPVVLRAHPELKLMGLGPMAVLPGHQLRGIGSELVRCGLEECKELGFKAVVVLGHPEYYPRFGFEPASNHGVSCQWDGVPDEAFMIMILHAKAMAGVSGPAKYRDEFDLAM